MKSTRRFPWLRASIFIFVGLVGVVAYDVSRANGDFAKSTTGIILNDAGVLRVTQQAWRKTMSSSARGYLWMETNAPIYYTTTVETLKPYGQLSKDIIIVVGKNIAGFYGTLREYVGEKTPVVVATIDQYAPGVLDTVQKYASNWYSVTKKYSSEYYKITADYLSTKVFVGEWAPEILQNKTQVALNATKFHMSSYFSWFREQVHEYSKLT